MTPNQELLIRIASKNPDHWHNVAGVCCQGRFSGRGMSTVIRSLEAKGLIKSRLVKFGDVYRVSIKLHKKDEDARKQETR